MKTKEKIFFAKLISFFLSFFLKKKKIRKINKIKFFIDLNEGIDLYLLIFRKFEYEIINTAKELIKNKKKNIIDIGANNGVHTLQFANELNFSHVYAIEPTNYSYDKLKLNIKLNKNLSNRIKIFKYFIKNKSIKLPKFVYSSWKLNNSKFHHPEHFGVKMSTKGTKTYSLDRFIISKNIKNIGLIKIDVDGHELFVLKSGKYILKKKIPILMELAPYLYSDFGYNYVDLIKYIKKFNYNFFSLNPIKKIHDIKGFTSQIKHGSSVNILLK